MTLPLRVSRGIVRLVVGWVAVSGLAPGHAGAQAPIDDLSLEEAIRLAHEHNPGYRIQESGLATLGIERREARAAFLPSATISNSLGYTASGERRFGDVSLATRPAQFSSVYNIGLSLSLSGSTFLQPGLVDAQAEATHAQVRGASAELVDQVTQAYLSTLQADEQLAQARAELERTRTYVRQAEAQVEVGAATPLDIRRAEIQEGQAEVQVLQAENAAVSNRLGLMRIIGVDLASDARLATEFDVFAPALDPEALVQRALEANPELSASRSQVAANRAQRRMAESQYLPSVSLSAGWSGSVFQADRIAPLVDDRLRQLSGQYESCVQENRIRDLLGDPPRDCSPLDPTDPVVETNVREQVRQANQGWPFDFDRQPFSLSMSVSIPVFTGFSRQLQAEQARVAESNAQHQVRAEELRLRSEVEAAYRAVETARRTAELQARIRETSQEELRLAQERFRLGLGTSIEVVDAQANLSEAERAEISAIYDFHASFAALEALVGESLRE